MVRYIKEYERKGIAISMVTIQNEPQAVQSWDSCIYSSEDEKIMVRDYLGPAFRRNGLGHIKILIWDHNKEIVYERAKEILEDQETNQYVAGVASHWYSGDHFESVALVREQYPEKELYFTEGCVEYSRFMDSDEVAKVPDGERVIVVMNKTNEDISFSLREYEKGGCLTIKAHSIQTICYQLEKESKI